MGSIPDQHIYLECTTEHVHFVRPLSTNNKQSIFMNWYQNISSKGFLGIMVQIEMNSVTIGPHLFSLSARLY